MSWKIELEDAPRGFDGWVYVDSKEANWNDFGYNYHASFRFTYRGESLTVDGYLLPVKGFPQLFHRSLSNAEQGKLVYFTSLLASPGQYKYLGLKLDPEDLSYLLIKLHEISYDRCLDIGKYQHIIQDEPFRLGVLRKSQAYLSLINGYASTYVQPPVGDAKIKFSFSTMLPNAKDFTRLEIDYRAHEHFDDRIHCLIGVNGMGKTTLLANLTVTAAELSNSAKDAPATVLYSQAKKPISSIDSTLSVERNFRFNRVVSYFSDPSSILPRSSSVGSFEYHSFNTTAERNTKASYQNLSYLLVTLLRVKDENFGFEKSQILTETLSSHIPMHLLAIPVTKECPEYCRVQDVDGASWSVVVQMLGEQRSLEVFGTIDTDREPSFLDTHTGKVIGLSSGQRSMFHFALHFLTLAGYGTLLIIDEPETYLHPNLISEYMMFLYKILKRTSSIALIATHSAYVVREVPTHCVHILDRNGPEISVGRPYLQTLGANVAEISLAVFGDSTVDAYHREVSEKIAKSNMPFEQIVQMYCDIFNIDMLMEIKNRISKSQEPE